MKKITALLCSVFVIANLRAQSPVAYYPCNGNVNDSSGNNLNGTKVGAVGFTTDRFGHPASALQFNGDASNRVEIADNPLLRPANLTISAWVKLNSVTGIASFVEKAVGTCNNDSWHDGTLNSSYSSWIGYSANCNDVSQLVSPLTAGIWQFVVITVNSAANSREMYVDGILVASAAFTTPLQYDNHPVVIGAAYENESINFPLNGDIDDIKIYNTALTASQVMQEFQAGIPFNKIASGNAISLDQSTGTRVNIGTGFNLQEFTIQLWVNPAATQTGFANIIDNNHSSTNWACELVTGTTYCWGVAGVCVNFNLAPDAWQQLTLIKTATESKVYVNGMLAGSAGSGAVNYANTPYLVLGAWAAGGRSWTGQMDEVRFWNIPLNETQIRERMCSKIEATDPLYPNLIGYYNFDEMTSTTVLDKSASGANGTIVNSAARVTSGASIGNAAAFDYTNATKTISISHASGETFTVTSTAGNPDGIQVYRVDEQPNTLNGSLGVGTNNKYFGVFQVNGTTPVYQAVYNYTGNPLVNAGNENTLALFRRENNAASSWTNTSASLNTTTNTLTCNGQSTEYILGSTGSALPVTLLNFSGIFQNGITRLRWQTDNEINLRQFEIEKSTDGHRFEKLGTKAANAQGFYSYDDTHPGESTCFYRLKLTDTDGRFTYSNIIKISATPAHLLSIFPNPASDRFVVRGIPDNGLIKISDLRGKLVKTQFVSPDTIVYTGGFSKGIYIVQYINGNTVQSARLIVQ